MKSTCINQQLMWKFPVDEQVGRRADEMAESMTVALLSMLIVAAASTLAVVSAIDDKCDACKAVAHELEFMLSKEKPRNHLDMRHRLDSKGERKGKVIDYRFSELRVIELLDGLCEKMEDYILQPIDSDRVGWVKVDDWDIITTNKPAARAHSKQISSFCGRLIEEIEDVLAEVIKKGSLKPENVSKVLCEDLSKHCTLSSGSSQADSDDDEFDREL